MAGLWWEVRSPPPDSKIKARLKTAINALAGARDRLSDTKCSDLVTQRRPGLQKPVPDRRHPP